MSIYAIRVETGKEIFVKKKMNEFLARTKINVVRAIHALEVVSNGGKRISGGLPGYIFIELITNIIPDELYHLLKAIPKVSKLIPDSIPQEQFDAMVQKQ